MKKIFCNKCDTPILLSSDKMKAAIENTNGKLCVVCPNCGRQMNLKLKTKKEDKTLRDRGTAVGSISVVENVFGYKQNFLLYEGENHIGRRNKDTQTDIPIITADPSMDRHHCIIICEKTSKGRMKYYLQDEDSMTGTFLLGREIEQKEKAILTSGDIITLGATTLIFSDELPDEELSKVELRTSHK